MSLFFVNFLLLKVGVEHTLWGGGWYSDKNEKCAETKRGSQILYPPPARPPRPLDGVKIIDAVI